jgi:hypothetical protein
MFAPLGTICRRNLCTVDHAGCSSKPFTQPKGAGACPVPAPLCMHFFCFRVLGLTPDNDGAGA